jgi:Fur family ferric uptake transcriptional regulator
MDPLNTEKDVLNHYLKKKELKFTDQRKLILEEFLNNEAHFTAEELYDKLKQKNPNIGLTTVYRTLKLFCECGLANELKLADGVSRYEHLFGHKHHDHLICIECGKFIEALDPEIEELQNRLAQKNNFKVLHHRMELYGICQDCATPT